jgi:hypothetical protein
MHAIRARGEIDTFQPGDPARRDFDFLHKLSTTTEGIVVLLGIAALVVESRQRRTAND